MFVLLSTLLIHSLASLNFFIQSMISVFKLMFYGNGWRMDVYLKNNGFVLDCWRMEYLERMVGFGIACVSWWKKCFERRKIFTLNRVSKLRFSCISVSCWLTDMKFDSYIITLKSSKNRCWLTEIGSSVNRDLTDSQPKFVGQDAGMMIFV